MIDIVKKEQREYIKETADKVYVHPLFYKAYSFVRKQLLDAFGAEERFEFIETEKTYYTLEIDLPDRYLIQRDQDYSIDFAHLPRLKEVQVAPFMFELMDILPYFYRYTFYKKLDWDYGRSLELEVPLGGATYQEGVSLESFLRVEDMTKQSYQREFFFNKQDLRIDHTFLYLALGRLYLPHLSDKDLESSDEYVADLKQMVGLWVEGLEDAQTSRSFIENYISRAPNEARISFYNAIADETFSLEELLKEETEYSRAERRYVRRNRLSAFNNLPASSFSTSNYFETSEGVDANENNIYIIQRAVYDVAGATESQRDQLVAPPLNTVINNYNILGRISSYFLYLMNNELEEEAVTPEV